MADDPVVELLAQTSATRLRDMDTKLSGQIADLQVQQRWVRRALEQKGAAPLTTDASSNGTGARAKRKRSNKREAIMKVLGADPNRVWLPSEVKEGLLAVGIDSSVEAVRVTLRRMGDAGELTRPPDGNGWQLPNPFLTESDPSGVEGPDDLRLEGDSAPV